MRVFLTIMVDSLRLLRARALFWVTLGFSALVALIFLSIGFSPQGFSLLFGLAEYEHEFLRAGNPLAEVVYVGGIFNGVVVGVWLSWAAVGLALVSCASIFPDFMAEGSIGVFLSKPVGRLRLFFYKYLGSLMFVALQVGLFCLIVFFALRWRLGVWNPSVFWAVPVVVLIFSYLYSVVTYVAVRTRSVMAAIFAAMLVWFVSYLGQKGEEIIYVLADREAVQTPQQTSYRDLHRAAVMAMTVLPKTGETARLLDRWVVAGGRRGISQAELFGAFLGARLGDREGIDAAAQRHSLGFVLGTSLAFEAVLLGLAAWRFKRMDF